MAENDDKKLYLLDAFALIYRAYYSFIRAPRINSKGFNTSAAYGFTSAVLDLIKREKPTHIAVVFDMAGPTERHLEHTEYKANREAMPEDIRNNLSYIRRIVEAFNIPILESEGYEADDVIGTLAKKAEKQGYQTYMVTPDKDFGQLVSENILMYKPGRGGGGPEIWGVKEVCEKFEVERPEQVIDILGLWGDAVDNIPGIPGIGEKTSKKLIAQYGSVEGLIEHADELKGKQKENVIKFAEQGLMSKRLATILLDAPVDLDPGSLNLDPPDQEKLLEVFSELEFRTLAKRILGQDVNLKQAQGGQQMDLFGAQQADEVVEDEVSLELVEFKNIENTKHRYHLVQTDKDIDALVAKLAKCKSFCFDTETTGIDERTAELVGLSFSFKAGEAYYVPTDEDQEEAMKLVAKFKAVFEDDGIEKVAQNIKYDLSILRRYGVQLNGPMFDTMLAHYLIQADMRHNMDVLAETYLGYKPVSIQELIGKKGKDQKSMREVPIEEVSEYAGEDADITWQLKEIFAPKIKEDGYEELFHKIEMPLTKVLSAMESEGIKIDIPALEDMSQELGNEIHKVGKAILEQAGTEFNIDSPKQLGQVLYEVLKITDKPKKTRTGQYSTSEDVLSGLVDTHPIVLNILEYRMLRKLKNTYVDTLPGLADPETHRIHTDYMQAVAATGRLSSNNPNLQNIPIRTERGRAIRKAFIPKDKDHVLLAADYSQIELRLVAALSGDVNMQEAFRQGMDIHAATAAKVFGVSLDAVDRDMRGKAKAVNFGIIYGQSAFGLSQNLKISRGEAREIIESYFGQFPRVRAYMDENIEFCRKNGYVQTIKGRRRYLRDINSANGTVRSAAERVAINAPMQGSAADIIKVAMIDIFNKMEGMRSKMLLQVHDELVFDAHKKEVDDLAPMVKELMESAVQLDVPLLVDMNVGKNWLEAH